MAKKSISLSHNTIDDNDIKKLVEWLSQKPMPNLTQGDVTKEDNLVAKFQKQFAEKIGGTSSLFCNSGSNAILMMLHTLIVSGKIKRGDKVLVNNCSWSTDVSNIINVGLVPVLVDCNMDDLSVDLKHLEELVNKGDCSVLLLVSLLGFSPDMNKIMEILNNAPQKIYLLEDCCESLLSSYNGKNLGSFGIMSCFSFFFSHHISGVEAGAVVYNKNKDDDENSNVEDILHMTAQHGWSRILSEEKREKYRKKYNISEFEESFTFFYPSYNCRNTSISAFILIEQMKKLDSIVKSRNENFLLYDSLIKNDYWKPNPVKNSFTSNLAYPIIHPKRNKIVEALNINGVASRPLVAGAISRQVFFYEIYGKISFKNADIVHDFGMYVPNDPSLSKEDIKYICNIINSVINETDSKI